MKNKNTFTTRIVVFRLIFVFISATVATSIAGSFLGTILDTLYMRTNNEIFYIIFRILSDYQIFFHYSTILIILILSFNWIISARVDDISRLVRKYISLEENVEVIELPRQLQSLQNELIQINQDIKLWKQVAKEAEHKKDELVVYLAHDIRTPLASTLGYLSLLEEEENLTTIQRQRFIEIALSKAERIQSLVDELFEITRYNVSQNELHKVKIDLKILILQLIEELYPEIEAKQVSVETSFRGSSLIFGDQQKIGRLFENILVNAIRYSPSHEKILITTEETESTIELKFKNLGIEIEEHELERLFDKFYRGDTSRQTSSGGSGLGLAIAKNIVASHQGTIVAKQEHHSICFIINLPKY